jgi:hypothetical protein
MIKAPQKIEHLQPKHYLHPKQQFAQQLRRMM